MSCRTSRPGGCGIGGVEMSLWQQALGPDIPSCPGSDIAGFPEHHNRVLKPTQNPRSARPRNDPGLANSTSPDDSKPGNLIEQCVPTGRAESEEVPRLLMQRERLVRCQAHDTSHTQHLVHLDRDFPWHQQVLKHRNTDHRVKCISRKVVRHCMRVPHDVYARPGDNVETRSPPCRGEPPLVTGYSSSPQFQNMGTLSASQGTYEILPLDTRHVAAPWGLWAPQPLLPKCRARLARPTSRE